MRDTASSGAREAIIATIRLRRDLLEYVLSAVEQDLERHGRRLAEQPDVHGPIVAALTEAHGLLEAAYAELQDDPSKSLNVGSGGGQSLDFCGLCSYGRDMGPAIICSLILLAGIAITAHILVVPAVIAAGLAIAWGTVEMSS